MNVILMRRSHQWPSLTLNITTEMNHPSQLEKIRMTLDIRLHHGHPLVV